MPSTRNGVPNPHLKLRALQSAGGATGESAMLLGQALLDGLDGRHDDGFPRRLRWYQAARRRCSGGRG